VILDEITAPIVLAPLGGGPSTPELAAAVSDAGGLGFLAWGYLAADQAASTVAATRSLTDRPFGVNVFHPVPGPADPAVYARYVERLERWARDRGAMIGESRFSDDAFDEKIDLLTADPVAVVSFTFGCPEAAVVDRLRAAGSEVWVTVTSPDEADRAAGMGADALVVQGIEAGGHRASFADAEDAPAFGLLSLLQLISARQSVPLVASGGIATGGAVAAALCAGARAVQMGSAFMLCPEAGTADAHREALRSRRPTSLTRAFTGRTARGIRNPFMDEHDAHAPYAYPEIHHVTAPLRRAARHAGDDSAINLWAGETHELARAAPAGEVVRESMREARAAGGAANARLASGSSIR
jgi:nitronate monooxygenase